MKRSLAWLALIGAALYAISTWPFADAVSHRNGEGISSSTAGSTSPASESKKAEYIAAAQIDLPTPQPALSTEPPVADAAIDEKSTAGLDPATSSVGQARAVPTYAVNLLQKVPLSARRTSVQSLRSPNVKPDGSDLLIPQHHTPAGFTKGFWLRWMRFPSPKKLRLRPMNSPKAKRKTRNEPGQVASRRASKRPGVRASRSEYTELKADQDFRPHKRRFGFFARRQMLRDGSFTEEFTQPR